MMASAQPASSEPPPSGSVQTVLQRDGGRSVSAPTGPAGVLPPPIPATAACGGGAADDVEVAVQARNTVTSGTQHSAPARPSDVRVALERAVPLSQSILFALQRAFYEEHSVAAWSKSMVPNYITTNSFLADRCVGCCRVRRCPRH